jgi:LPS sulfotransferase NodH
VNVATPPPAISRSYAICTTPRTGSNFLCELLQATGVAGRPDEYFWNPPVGHEQWSVDEQYRYVEQIRRAGTTPNGVFGVKLMWSYLGEVVTRLAAVSGRAEASPPDVLAATFPNLRYIWLTRRDKLRQGISFYRALATERWRSTDPGSRADADVPFDFQAIDALIATSIQDERSWRQFFEQHGINPLAIEYENLDRAPETIVRQILAFLGLKVTSVALPTDWRHQRQADDLTEAWVRQYQALTSDRTRA